MWYIIIITVCLSVQVPGLLKRKEAHTSPINLKNKLKNPSIVRSLLTKPQQNRMPIFSWLIVILTSLESLAGEEDPSSWPGNLEPLASKAKLIQVGELDSFPSPQEFFMNYAYRGVPVVFRGGAKGFPAYSKWSDLYLKSIPEAQWTMVGVEINKKEDRTLPTQTMPLREFIQRYQSHNEYLVTSVPEYLRYDVLMPLPLQCTQVINNLVDCLLWISGGGTKSVLHNDNVDNINCIFSGRKEFLLLNYTKYKDDIIFDRIEEGAMSVDVDKVDFTKFPTLAKVDFHFASVSAGDCIFLPYKW
ncbi:Lysine-specific demethylase 8 [Holothuria leucospilota]|uniref:Lysine-specific demethylase 8 n=1 Tax=Holothuria leucospilota TaxID=206669 RepID=A0A9Q0YS38_HOLLE|nr:Lysine-specific demethylase 8 [Holothuria leucospilota]